MDGCDTIPPEMQAKLKMGSTQDLYAFWGDRIYRELAEGEDFLLNLASKEYSRAAEKYIDRKTRFVTCVFGELSDGKVKVKGTMAKMARGEMVRWLSEKNIAKPDEMKEFTGLGYGFDAARSTDKELVFSKYSGAAPRQENPAGRTLFLRYTGGGCLGKTMYQKSLVIF